MNTRTTTFIGIGGGSASGKTTIARKLAKETGALLISLDNFYRLDLNDAADVNWDDPDSFDWDALYNLMINFRVGLSGKMTVHDHATFKSAVGSYVEPRPVVIIEGIHAFTCQKICVMFSMKIFVDCDVDVALCRRIKRDKIERDRSAEKTIEMWEQTVKPAYLRYIEPMKMSADIIIPNTLGDIESNAGVEMLVKHLQEV